ncbi:hypothetical protein Hanom_Chr11g00994661 [Helianthus anomalus]
MVDIIGRSFVMSWVHKRPIFKYLHASSTSNSPCIAVSMSSTNSFRSYRSHVCLEQNKFMLKKCSTSP